MHQRGEGRGKSCEQHLETREQTEAEKRMDEAEGREGKGRGNQHNIVRHKRNERGERQAGGWVWRDEWESKSRGGGTQGMSDACEASCQIRPAAHPHSASRANYPSSTNRFFFFPHSRRQSILRKSNATRCFSVGSSACTGLLVAIHVFLILSAKILILLFWPLNFGQELTAC